MRPCARLATARGTGGMLHTEGYPMMRSENARKATMSGRFLRSRAATIEGGTSEIMRNILGSWRAVPR